MDPVSYGISPLCDTSSLWGTRLRSWESPKKSQILVVQCKSDIASWERKDIPTQGMFESIGVFLSLKGGR